MWNIQLCTVRPFYFCDIISRLTEYNIEWNSDIFVLRIIYKLHIYLLYSFINHLTITIFLYLITNTTYSLSDFLFKLPMTELYHKARMKLIYKQGDNAY